jgi:hypothetical protein
VTHRRTNISKAMNIPLTYISARAERPLLPVLGFGGGSACAATVVVFVANFAPRQSNNLWASTSYFALDIGLALLGSALATALLVGGLALVRWAVGEVKRFRLGIMLVAGLAHGLFSNLSMAIDAAISTGPLKDRSIELAGWGRLLGVFFFAAIPLVLIVTASFRPRAFGDTKPAP